MIVVDTNVIAAAILRDDRNVVVDRLFSTDPDWVAPPLWRDEFANVLATALRLNRMALGEAFGAMERAQSLVTNHDFSTLPLRTLELAAASGCTAYDCEYVAVAEALDVPLYTFDRALLRAFPGNAREPA